MQGEGRLVTHWVCVAHTDRAVRSETKVNVDEIGSIGGCPQAVGGNATRGGTGRWFFNAIGAVFAYTYAHLAGLGVEIMAASQVTTATCTRLTR